jgi:NADH-quinone oxidoreductase subunit G
MVSIQIDGKHYEVTPGKNLLETCLALGIYVPHFCYHPALGSVGACRLCAVKKYRNTDDQVGRIVMSCMEPVTDGLVINVNDPEAVAFRAAIIESLMINHPHDCPICDEGGECHLQDMTVMTGHNYRRYGFKKRTHENQYLGPFINHEMNRCIQCYRCVRFYNDYAGGNDLGVFGAHDHVYFGRHQDGNLESEFSGNLVEVCPTGVFTDKTLKAHYTRKWDLTNAPSVCVHCSVGCNTIAGERYGGLRRIMTRYNGAVNGYFLCDRGRFGYEFVNDEKRIRKPQIRIAKGNDPEDATPEKLADALTEAFSGTTRWLGIGSPRASLEANFALSCLVGTGNFFHGISHKEHELVKTAIHILSMGNAHSPSLKEIEKADAVFILGEDVTHTAPMTALAVRQASRSKDMEIASKSGIPEWNDYARREKVQGVKSPIFIATPQATKLDDIAEKTYHASAGDIARLGFAVALLLNKEAPVIPGIDKVQQDLAKQIADAFRNAKNPLIITGVHCGSPELLESAANISEAFAGNGKKVMLSLLLPECNSLGLGMMEGGSLEDLVAPPDGDKSTGLVILENDLYRRGDRGFIDSILEKCNPVIVLDHLENETTLKADILLPVGTFAESEGTLVNNEGRAQRFYRVFPQVEPMKESWLQIRNLIRLSRNDAGSWEKYDDLVNEMTEKIPAFSKIKKYFPAADFRILNEKIKRQTIRFSGRTAMTANIAVSEPKLPDDPGSPLAFSMEGANEDPPSSLVSYYWVPGWNSYQAINFYLDAPNGSLKGGDPGIRLIESSEERHLPFYKPSGLPFKAKPGEWLVVPAYRIFGSEELSSKSSPVVSRIVGPFVYLNKTDSEGIGGKENDKVEISLSGKTIEVKLKIDNSLPDGIATVSVGLPGMPFLDLPEWGKIKIKKS